MNDKIDELCISTNFVFSFYLDQKSSWAFVFIFEPKSIIIYILYTSAHDDGIITKLFQHY